MEHWEPCLNFWVCNLISRCPTPSKKNTYKKSKIKFLDPILGKNKKLSKLLSRIMPKSFKKTILDKMYVEGSKKKLMPEERILRGSILKMK